jgi:hypothetical protein
MTKPRNNGEGFAVRESVRLYTKHVKNVSSS